MEPYFRVGEPFTRAELDSLRLDGLLTQVTEDCLVPATTPITPPCRGGALPSLPPGLAYSHATAAWIWWGIGRVRHPLDCSTTTRRRVRAEPVTRLVHETSLREGDSAVLAGRLVTSRGRTLFDVLRAAVVADEEPDASRERLAPVGTQDWEEFRDYLVLAQRRPHAVAVRALAGRVLSLR